MKKEPKILLIEDNSGDVELITQSFRDRGLSRKIKIINNGEEALKYLSLKENEEMEYRPDIVLLDINIPKIDGKEILHYIKTSEQLKMIPVIMLTTSSLQSDLVYCYSNYANCYIVKPADVNEYIRVIRCIELFWLDCVAYPNKN